MDRTLFFEDLSKGDVLPELRRCPGAVTLFRFSAVSWNAHRIHYDAGYAAREGYSGTLVHSQLHGCHLVQAVTDWMGPQGRLVRFSWQNRAVATSGSELVVRATVRELYEVTGVGHVEIDLEERDAAGTLCAAGQATVTLPSRTIKTQPEGRHSR
jgi:acyl dehydratase